MILALRQTSLLHSSHVTPTNMSHQTAEKWSNQPLSLSEPKECTASRPHPTLGVNGGSDSRVFPLQVCDQVSHSHQHGPQEEQTLLIPGG